MVSIFIGALIAFFYEFSLLVDISFELLFTNPLSDRVFEVAVKGKTQEFYCRWLRKFRLAQGQVLQELRALTISSCKDLVK